MEVIFLNSARKDIRDAFDWYEVRQIGLGSKFIKEVIDYSKKLKNENIEYRKYVDDIQYVRLKKFPFSLYFLKEADQKISILAVLFNRQDILKILRKRK